MKAVRRWIVVIPGSRWTDVAGTDRQLATALAHQVDVVWVDPPFPFVPGRERPQRDLQEVAPRIYRLQFSTTPGASRTGLRVLAERLLERRLARELYHRGIIPEAVLVLSPRSGFPRAVPGQRVLFVTDDWVAGAAMMGLSTSAVRRRLAGNLTRADAVAAVTPQLVDSLTKLSGRSVTVVPNGACVRTRPPCGRRERLAGVVGQLNERLDFSVLTAVAERGVPLLLVGPRTVRDEQAAAQLSELLSRPGVEWVGGVPHAEVGQHLARMSVGLTPYADSPFNRSSYPLKTLEYLGAGIPVVSTDLPAARGLDSRHVSVATNPSAFADEVERVLARFGSTGAGQDPGEPDADERDRLAFAAQHSWSARAADILRLAETQIATR